MTELKVLDDILNSKLSFESHIRFIAASAFSKIGILKNALCLFGDPIFILRRLFEYLISSARVLDLCLNLCGGFSFLSSRSCGFKGNET